MTKANAQMTGGRDRYATITNASFLKKPPANVLVIVEEPDEDNMEEINLDNVIGRRTRGKVIDFAKAAQDNPPEEDEDSEDDDDFEVEDSRMDED